MVSCRKRVCLFMCLHFEISSVFEIWYHYYVICTLVIIFNWWLSSKDMKFQVLIKEVLVVFRWLTCRIILLCSLARGHRPLLLVQETPQELLYICIYIYIYLKLKPQKFEHLKSWQDLPKALKRSKKNY